MRIARFEWPDDMEPHERTGIADVEGIAREAVRNVPTGARGPALAYDALEDALIRSTSAPAITRLLRIVTDHEPIGAIRVRFTWHRWERERRENAARVRSWNEREDASRRRRVIAQLEANDLEGVTRPHLTTPIREIARQNMSPAQWGSARDSRGVCGICDAGPSMWCDTAVHDRPARPAIGVDIGRTITMTATQPIQAGELVMGYDVAAIQVTREELEDAEREPLNLNARLLLEEVERLDRAGAIMADQLYNADAPRTPNGTIEFRREVLGEWADPAFGLGPRSNPHASRDHTADAALYARGSGERFEDAARRKIHQREAVDRLLLIMLRIAQAAARAREGARMLLESFRVVLRAWSASPTLLELDIDHAPFGVDLAPAEDDAAARYALLELTTPPTPS